MAYSESLFVALSAWALVFLQREQWLAAGAMAALAGLTRPVGVAVSVALLVAAGLSLKKGELSGRKKSAALFSCLLAPSGAASYVLWVGSETGRLFGYLDVQNEWGNGFDGGWAFSVFVAGGNGWTAVPILIGLYCLAVWPHWGAWRMRLPLPLIAYSAVVVVLAIGASGYFGSKPRLLLPAFPVLIPLAVLLARRRPVLAWIVSVFAVAVSAIYGAFWLHGSGPP